MRSLSVSLRYGVDGLIWRLRARLSTIHFIVVVISTSAASAPPSSGLAGLAMILSGSNIHKLPRPWQRSQAPNWLLKLNDRGSSCGTLAPHSGQASFRE